MLRSSVFSKVFIVLKFRANFAPPLRLVLDGRRQAIAKASGIWRSSKQSALFVYMKNSPQETSWRADFYQNITIIVLCIPSADFGFEK